MIAHIQIIFKLMAVKKNRRKTHRTFEEKEKTENKRKYKGKESKREGKEERRKRDSRMEGKNDGQEEENKTGWEKRVNT